MNMKKFLFLAAGAFALCSCSDTDSSAAGPSAGPSHESGMVALADTVRVYVQDPRDWKLDEYSGRVAAVDSVDQLPNCNSKTDGDTVLVKNLKKVYYCDSENWVYFGKAISRLKSSSSSKAKSSSSKGKSPTDIVAVDTPDIPLSSSSATSSSSSFDVDEFFRMLFGSSSSSVFVFPGSSSNVLVSSSSATQSSSSEETVVSRCKDYGEYPGFYWNGEYGDNMIWTKLDNGTESAGYWYDIDDSPDGGASVIEWPRPRGNEYDENAFDGIMDACMGICGTYKLNASTLTRDPCVGVAFNIAGVSEETIAQGNWYTPAEPADASEWGGICVYYSTDADSTFLELSMGERLDAEAGYILPRVHLPKSSEPREFCARWSSFKVPDISREKFDGIANGTEVAAKLATVRFWIQGKDGETGYFNLMEIGGYCR